MLGLPREQIIGRTNAELQVYATPEERVRLLDELASKGQVHRLRILCQSHGEIVPGTISAVLVEFDSEPCMFFIFHDMRDYEKAVDQLHSANRLLQQAGHLAQLGAWEDRRGQGLVYWSDVRYDIHGVPRNSPLPRDYLSTFVAPEHRELEAATLGAGTGICSMGALRATASGTSSTAWKSNLPTSALPVRNAGTGQKSWSLTM